MLTDHKNSCHLNNFQESVRHNRHSFIELCSEALTHHFDDLINQGLATFFAQRTGLKMNFFADRPLKYHKCFVKKTARIYLELKTSILFY